VPLTFSVANPEPGETYTWIAAGGSPETGTGTSFTTTFSTPGTYVVAPFTADGREGKCHAIITIIAE
jgi:hypothetical protein